MEYLNNKFVINGECFEKCKIIIKNNKEIICNNFDEVIECCEKLNLLISIDKNEIKSLPSVPIRFEGIKI
jgi:hypothetical protein